MDTGSHLLFGVTLAGLATLQPDVAQNPLLLQAVLAATVAGSHAPDFDTVTRLKGYAVYLKHHRGITHSLPALLVWPALLSALAAAVFGTWDHYALLFGWAAAAVILHVGLDLLNAYGVQCLRPFSSRWLHLDILPLTDPFLLVLHGGGALLWAAGAIHPGVCMAAVYTASFVYVIARWLHKRILFRRLSGYVKDRFGASGPLLLVPGLTWRSWQFAAETEDSFHSGTVRGARIVLKDTYVKDRTHPVVEAAMAAEGVRAFLAFAQSGHVSWDTHEEGYVVKWREVRFWHEHKLPFGIDVTLDREMKVLSEHLGWTKKAWEPPYV
ncbi:metal-dependent hydrolase [Paenibacillus sp. UNC499MF]|uniref:metal-dependent hydrolase n=1 Tax=Paenibacillus sp. UNC499MF TaxID=1502751 RepID=UPI0008A06F5B|nr:metal-dependent hydrolase [Paenibacillus sp. UNC499MF]SEG05738.1 inner membrane protein [Paenibacillus sp. UNC499MF]